MAKFRKKPVVIEAQQFLAAMASLPFTGEGDPVLYGCDHGKNAICNLCGKFYINTLEGPHVVSEGDWVICGVKGEFYSCKPDIFELTYESTE